MLFLCPMGVRNAQDAPTATAIRNGSGLTPSLLAMSTAMGAEITAVAVLLSTSDRVITTIIRMVRTTAAE